MQSSILESRSTNEQVRVCASCKRRKRRCDKALPACLFCARKGWKCEYESVAARKSDGHGIRSREKSAMAQRPRDRHTLESEADLHISTPQSADLLESIFTPQAESRDVVKSTFPAVLFLDPGIYWGDGLEQRRRSPTLPPDVVQQLTDVTEVRNLSSFYFDTVHPWVPIISKLRFYSCLDRIDALHHLEKDTALQLLCMKLACWSPTPVLRNPRTHLYTIAKRIYLETEDAGFFNVKVLQAQILIAIYEIGHAIYPSAYLTVGACARYGVALGLNGKVADQLSPPQTWIEVEERKRVWWMVLILDRYVNVSNPLRALATEDLKSSDILPADDSLWDKGIISSVGQHNLLSPNHLEMGRFARFAQATYLLGRVYRHVADRSAEGHGYDEREMEEEAIQLNRTLRALISLAHVEGSIRKLEFCSQTSVCYRYLPDIVISAEHGDLTIRSALLALQESYMPSSPVNRPFDDHSHYEELIGSKAAVVEAMLEICAVFLRTEDLGLRCLSPFILQLIYEAAIICIGNMRTANALQASEALEVFRSTFRALDCRWRAAGTMLELLEVREVRAYN